MANDGKESPVTGPGEGPRPGEPMVLLASGIDHDPLPAAETTSNHVYGPGEKILELTDANVLQVKRMGFSLQQIAAGPHFNQDIGPDGRGDWRDLDAALAVLARHDADTLLAAGYWWMPPWMADDPRAVPVRCMTHDHPAPVLSLWSPFTCEWIERCVKALTEHLRRRRARVRAICVMLYGDFGEALYPAGYLTPGTYYGPPVFDQIAHSHSDFWCQDACARADFVRFLTERYGSQRTKGLDSSSDELFPSPPERGRALRPWVDFLQWYDGSMTAYASRVLEIYRRYFPDEELMIWLGGGTENHTHGQDYTALPKIAKAPRATIRATTSGWQGLYRKTSVPRQSLAWSFQRNYVVVKRVATACWFYGAPLWLEPPYPPGQDVPSAVTRVFEAISCGAAGYFEWTRTLQRQEKLYRKLSPLMNRDRPRVDVAVYFPVAAHRGDPDSTIPGRFWNGAAHLRAVVDFDVVDDLLIADGALDRYAVLVLPQADLLEPDVLDRMQQWVTAGGVLLVECDGPMSVVDQDGRDERPWLGVAAGAKAGRGAMVDDDSPETAWLTSTRRRFAGCAIGSLGRLTDGAAPILMTSGGPAVARIARGSGTVVTCAPSTRRPPLLTTVLADYVNHTSDDRFAAARLAGRWMNGDGRLFATVFDDHLLLGNLSSKRLDRSHAGRQIALKPYELKLLPL